MDNESRNDFALEKNSRLIVLFWMGVGLQADQFDEGGNYDKPRAKVSTFTRLGRVSDAHTR